MNSAVFGKPTENLMKHRDINVVTANKRRSCLVSGPNYHTTKCFSENLLAIEMREIKVKMKKRIYLGLSILEISNEFWYDYIEPNYKNNAKLYYIDNLIIHIRNKDVYKDIANDIEKRFHTSNNETERPLPKCKNKKVKERMKEELGGKIMAEFVGLRPKAYSYLIDNGSSHKKAEGKKKCVIK